MTTPRLTAGTVAAIATAAAAVLLATAGCTDSRQTGAAVSPGHAAARQTNGAPAGGAPASESGARVIPSQSPHPPIMLIPSAQPDSAITTPSTPSTPDGAVATSSAIEVAKEWAIAANSSSYLDPHAGSWTARAAALVTGTEAAAEQQQRSGTGGSTWTQIRAGGCVTGLRELAAGIPADGPTRPDRHLVEVTALTTLTCATGQVQLSRFAAQLTVIRVRGRWLVADVRH